MSSNIESIQREARFDFESAYPWELRNGGLGLKLAVSGTTTRGALVGAAATDGPSMIVYNPNDFDVYIAHGDSSVDATLSCYPIRAGDKEIVSISPDSTHVAVVSDSGTGNVWFHRGGGN